MCRDKLHGGRRCPNDGSVARRLRRKNASLKARLKDQVIQPTPDTTLGGSVSFADYSNSIEDKGDDNTANIRDLKIQEISESLKSYNEKNEKFVNPESGEYTPKHHATPLSENEVELEEQLIEIGKKVESLAVDFGAPSEDEWQKESQAHEEYKKLKSVEIDALIADSEQKIKEATDLARSMFGDYYTSPTGGQIEINEETVSRISSLSVIDESEDNELFFDGYSAIMDRSFIYENEVSEPKDNSKELLERRTKGYMKALESLGVSFSSGESIRFRDKENNTVEPDDQVSEAMTYYPSSWSLNVLHGKGNYFGTRIERRKRVRAGYSMFFKKIVLDEDGSLSTAVHEIGHLMETHNPQVTEAQRRFLYRRSGYLDYQNKKIKKKPRLISIYHGEKGYDGGFSNLYAAKIYDNPDARGKKFARETNQPYKGVENYEILTMGMESTFMGEYGGNIGLPDRKTGAENKADPEHGSFILGLLATGAKR